MPSPLKVPRGCGFRVTELGRSAAASVETCGCRYVVSLGMLICCYCGSCAGDLRALPKTIMTYNRKPD